MFYIARSESGDKIIQTVDNSKRGGEGSVCQIKDENGKPLPGLAKIFHKVSPEKEKKVKFLITQRHNEKVKAFIDHSSWPMAELLTNDDKKKFVGYIMGQIKGVKLGEYEKRAPNIQRNINLIASICNSLSGLHKFGLFVGDFNPDNLMIVEGENNGCAAYFIDVDSMSVYSKEEEYRCKVETIPGYSAPELLPNNKLDYTIETDLFALAVHIFKLLTKTHPFMCSKKPKAKVPNHPNLDIQVKNKASAFFCTAGRGYVVPSYSPTLDCFPSYLRNAFYTSFFGKPNQRLTADEWIECLKSYKNDLRECKDNSEHVYWAKNKTCPYCQAEKRYEAKINGKKVKNKVKKKRFSVFSRRPYSFIDWEMKKYVSDKRDGVEEDTQ